MNVLISYAGQNFNHGHMNQYNFFTEFMMLHVYFVIIRVDLF